MPYDIVEEECTQHDGTKGNWKLVKKESREEVSCHKTKELAQMSAGFRQEGEEDE